MPRACSDRPFRFATLRRRGALVLPLRDKNRSQTVKTKRKRARLFWVVVAGGGGGGSPHKTISFLKAKAVWRTTRGMIPHIKVHMRLHRYWVLLFYQLLLLHSPWRKNLPVEAAEFWAGSSISRSNQEIAYLTPHFSRSRPLPFPSAISADSRYQESNSTPMIHYSHTH